jgi:hypothetical protein
MALIDSPLHSNPIIANSSRSAASRQRRSRLRTSRAGTFTLGFESHELASDRSIQGKKTGCSFPCPVVINDQPQWNL